MKFLWRRTINSQYQFGVILWSHEELEPYFLYERAADRLGRNCYASTLTDMANVTHQLWFTS